MIKIRERTNVKVRLNNDLLELMTDSGHVWWTVVDTLQYLYIVHCTVAPTSVIHLLI